MDEMRVLIYVGNKNYAEFVAREFNSLKFPKTTHCVLLHVRRKNAKQPKYPDALKAMAALLSEYFTSIESKDVDGDVEKQILSEINSDHYNLLVLGNLKKKKGLFKRHLSSTIKKIISEVNVPILLVRRYKDNIAKVLICTAGEKISADTLKFGGRLVSYSQAQVWVLHVMSQLVLDINSPAEDLLDSAQSAIQKQTREGVHLAWAVEQIQKAGVTSQVIPVLRHGLVLDQVVAELREGKYDLLVIGSHQVSGRSHLLDMFLEDVTSELVSETGSSVLIV
jgi:nucleotide-binding universal stress UspA family protein